MHPCREAVGENGPLGDPKGVSQPPMAGGATPLSVGPLLVCVGAEWVKEVGRSTIMEGRPTPYDIPMTGGPHPLGVGPLGFLLTKFELVWPKFIGRPTSQLWPNMPIFYK